MFDLKKAANDVLGDDEFEFNISGDPTCIRVEVCDGDFFVARFALSTLPANPKYVVGWGLEVDEDFRGRGIAQHLLELRMEIIRESEAHAWMSTVRWDNEAETHIMRKYGFEPVVGTEEDDKETALWARTVEQTEELPVYV